MSESWTDKTVSMDNVDKEEFDGELAHVTVSENGITVEFKDEEDWKRIQREVGDDAILRSVRWEAVEEVDTETEHLYYPHINVEAFDTEQRVYFLEDEEELLENCVNAIERYWNAYKEAGAGSGTGYSYEGGTETDGADGERGEEVELEADEEDDGEDDETDEDKEADDEEDDDESLREEAMEIVEEFIGD